ncbi:enhancer of split mgamma protein-like [Chelonus insularis]|uniref:enhancer of split mgamma protein-like n=1 Tax=Chelonus insularis TaxID=460826 RepID=UPI00158D1917|nr:enhancer of split mgamma protein-like [Chelonus insularis]
MMAYDYPHPVSRTYQYKKVTKPLLERKRRARINRCLEELKDLMVDALETEGENISKLEKADILELTVRHLQRLQASRPSGLSSTISNEDAVAESRWQSGFGHCAAEACKYLASLPGESGEKLARHLATGLQSAQKMTLRVKSMKGASASQGKSDINTHQNVPVSSSVDASSSLSSVITSRQVTSPINSPSFCEKYKEVNDDYPILNNAPIATEVIDSPYPQPVHSPPRIPVLNHHGTDSNLQQIPVITEKMEKCDDDEEIDVEKIDEMDPMWRPW